VGQILQVLGGPCHGLIDRTGLICHRIRALHPDGPEFTPPDHDLTGQHDSGDSMGLRDARNAGDDFASQTRPVKSAFTGDHQIRLSNPFLQPNGRTHRVQTRYAVGAQVQKGEAQTTAGTGTQCHCRILAIGTTAQQRSEVGKGTFEHHDLLGGCSLLGCESVGGPTQTQQRNIHIGGNDQLNACNKILSTLYVNTGQIRQRSTTTGQHVRRLRSQCGEHARPGIVGSGPTDADDDPTNTRTHRSPDALAQADGGRNRRVPTLTHLIDGNQIPSARLGTFDVGGVIDDENFRRDRIPAGPGHDHGQNLPTQRCTHDCQKTGSAIGQWRKVKNIVGRVEPPALRDGFARFNGTECPAEGIRGYENAHRNRTYCCGTMTP
jgi:hypothetical protein